MKQEIEQPDYSSDSDTQNSDEYSPIHYDQPIETTTNLENITRRGRGIPKGSKNKSIYAQETFVKEPLFNILTESDTQIPIFEIANKILFSAKEVLDLKLSLQLREKGMINTPGKLVQVVDQAEFQSLIKNGVIKIIKYNPVKHNSIRLFNSRLVREV